MRFTIEQHKEMLRNQEQYIELERENLKRKIITLDYDEKAFFEYKAQIALAEARGLSGFDSDRLGKKRGIKK